MKTDKLLLVKVLKKLLPHQSAVPIPAAIEKLRKHFGIHLGLIHREKVNECPFYDRT